MAFTPKTWETDEYPTAGKMNQTKDNLNWLYAAALPVLYDDEGTLKADTSLGLYIVHFALIDTSAADGEGAYGAEWAKLWGPPQVGFAIEITWPDTIFSGTPMVVGHSIGSDKLVFGRCVTARWDECATGYKVSFKDTGGDQYPISSPFGYTALVIGTRKTSPE